MNVHPQDLPLRTQANAISTGELDATELLEATLERIDDRNPAINAIVDVSANDAVKMLSEAPDGPLHGVPVAIKDQFALPWRAPRDGAPANLAGIGQGESAMYKRLRDAGAVIVAVTNMHELGIGSTGHISAYGPVGTPWDPARCAGGSSGGSASAVGARLVGGAIGTDGGGSIRYPSAYCGVLGLKLTWGRMPSQGYVKRTATLGAPGPICRDAADARLLAGAMLGMPLAERRVEKLKVGVPEIMWEDLDPQVASCARSALDAIADAGAEIVRISLSDLEHARIATVLLLAMEVAPSEQQTILAEIEPDLSPIGRALTKFQLLIPGPAIARAELVRSQVRRSLASAFESVDALAWPASPAPPPLIENPTVELPSGLHPADYANVGLGGIANLGGVPVVTMPCGFTTGKLPVGLQLLGRWSEDEALLDLAEGFERATAREFVDAVPPLAEVETLAG